jgi:chaperonin GroES
MSQSLSVRGARVLIRRLKEEPVKSSLIEVISDDETPSIYGFVIAVGPGRRMSDGTYLPLEVNVGDTIITKLFVDTKLSLNNEELALVNEDDILAVLER